MPSVSRTALSMVHDTTLAYVVFEGRQRTHNFSVAVAAVIITTTPTAAVAAAVTVAAVAAFAFALSHCCCGELCTSSSRFVEDRFHR